MKNVLIMGCEYSDTIIPLEKDIELNSNNFFSTSGLIKRMGGVHNITREFPSFIKNILVHRESIIFQSTNSRTSFTTDRNIIINKCMSIDEIKERNIGWIHFCYLDCIIDLLSNDYLKKLKSIGIILSADLASKNIHTQNRKMKYIDCLITSTSEYKYYSYSSADWILHNPTHVSFEDRSMNPTLYTNPYYIKNPKNVLGAGDVFSGWIINETMKGNKLKNAIKTAQKMTALYVKRRLKNEEV